MMLTAISILLFVSVSVFAWALLPDASRRLVRRRIFSEVSEGKRPNLIEPLANFLAPIHRRLPLGWYTAEISRALEAAGLYVPPTHFLVCQELGALAGAGIYLTTHGAERVIAPWLALFVVAGFFVPALWLRNRIQTRRLTVQRDLPEVVDLLTLSVSAGGDFMSALNRIVREFRPCPVREELGIVVQEVGVGKRRRDALRAFAERVKTPEASTFARTIIQVDRMGTGMAEALTILSEDMRLARFHWAERFAQQAPMKMLIPLILSLGASMIIVAGPIFVKFFRGDLMGEARPGMSASEAMGTVHRP